MSIMTNLKPYLDGVNPFIITGATCAGVTMASMVRKWDGSSRYPKSGNAIPSPELFPFSSISNEYFSPDDSHHPLNRGLKISSAGGDYEAGIRVLTLRINFDTKYDPQVNISQLPVDSNIVIDGLGTFPAKRTNSISSVYSAIYTMQDVPQTQKDLDAGALHDRIVLLRFENVAPYWPANTPDSPPPAPNVTYYEPPITDETYV